MTFHGRELDKFITEAADAYNGQAPTVMTFLDNIALAVADREYDKVSMRQLMTLSALYDGQQWQEPRYASRFVQEYAN